jgi:hypothetical protein
LATIFALSSSTRRLNSSSVANLLLDALRAQTEFFDQRTARRR